MSVRVSLQSVSESAGSLRPSQLAVCGRVRWQSMLESVHVGGPYPSQLAVCVRVSWQSVSELGGSLRPASASVDSLCLSQLAGCVCVSPCQFAVCVPVSWQSVSESGGSLWTSQMAVYARVSSCWRSMSESIGSLRPSQLAI